MIEKNKEYLHLFIFIFSLIIFSFYLENPLEIYSGVIKIIKANNILVSDYFIIANKGATFFNAGILGIFNLFLLYKYRLKLNGLLIASVFLVLSFGFMGKNILNIIPFYIGAYFYSIFSKKEFRSLLPITMMSTTLAPLVSSLGMMGFLIAIISSFLIQIISKNTLLHHGGYNLYNTGYAAGLLSIIIYALLKINGIKFDLNRLFYTEFDDDIFIFLIIIFTYFIIIGLLKTKNFLYNIIAIHRHSGRLVSDFVQKEGYYISIFNMGILGMFSLMIAKYYNILNSPVICSIFTVVAFGGFGKHLRNIIPIIIGVIIAKNIFVSNISLTIFLMTVFFSTTLAPIAGKYGIIFGILAGIIHFSLATHIGIIHGGINLYNNGLAAGILSSVYVPILDEMLGVFKLWKK